MDKWRVPAPPPPLPQHFACARLLTFAEWRSRSHEQLMLFQTSGGNARARQYFAQHGVRD